MQPSNTVLGLSISPAVKVSAQDEAGNTLTQFSAPIQLAIESNPGGGTLSGTVTQNPVNGVATFSNLSINKAGTGYTLKATADGALSRVSSEFTILSRRLIFSVQPSNTAAGAMITPAVRVAIQDTLGNVITSANDTITLAIDTNPGGGTLSGTLSVQAVSGTATFNGISINKTGVGYKLSATSGTLTNTGRE